MSDLFAADDTIGEPAVNISIFGIFVLITLVITFRASRNNKSAADYYAAGRNISAPTSVTTSASAASPLTPSSRATSLEAVSPVAQRSRASCCLDAGSVLAAWATPRSFDRFTPWSSPRFSFAARIPASSSAANSA